MEEHVPDQATEPLLLTIPEAARRLSIGRSTAYELVAAGELDVVHIGRAARVPREAIERLVERLRIDAASAGAPRW